MPYYSPVLDQEIVVNVEFLIFIADVQDTEIHASMSASTAASKSSASFSTAKRQHRLV